MIKNNFFYIKDIKHIVFIGFSDLFEKLISINNDLGIKTTILTCSDQHSQISDKINYKVFDKLDNRFKKYVQENVNINETLFVSLGSRFIFKEKDKKKFFNYNLVNFHGSRLPLDSGGGGMSWRILRGDRIDNQLVHLIDEGIDTGPILKNKKSIFPASCKIPLDHEEYSKKNFKLFYEEFVKELLSGKKFILKFQSDYIGRYNSRLNTKINGWIDWDLGANDLIKFIDAFDEPYIGAQTTINNLNVRIKKAQLHSGDSSNHPYMTGLISRHDEDWIVVSTRDKEMLLIEKVLDEKNNNILIKLKVGDRFISSPDKLFSSKKDRVKYNSKGLK